VSNNITYRFISELWRWMSQKRANKHIVNSSRSKHKGNGIQEDNNSICYQSVYKSHR